MDKFIASNPWWEPNGEKNDPDLIRASLEPLNYNPSPFSLGDLKLRNVYTLRGPRRSGKTVALKKLIVKTINQGHPRRKFLWFAADTLRTLAQLEKHFRAIVEGLDQKTKEEKFFPPVLIVDEITSIEGWQRVVKKLRDDGTLLPFCLILTGSSAADLRKGAERMPGRRRDINYPENRAALDRTLLPMSFDQFKEQLKNNLGPLPDELFLKEFLSVGGYPYRIGLFLRKRLKNEVFNSEDGLEDLFDALIGEFERRGLNRAIALEILGRLSLIGSSAISWEGFAKTIESASRDTVKNYIRLLGDSFLLATVHSYDAARHRLALKRDRKLIWMDPALSYLASWSQVGEKPIEASLAEFSVGSKLIREFERTLNEGVAFNRSVFTWKSAKGKEVDFIVIPQPKVKPLPVEVKYQNTISDWDFQVMERAFGQGLLITASVLKEREKSKAIPLANFLSSKTLIS